MSLFQEALKFQVVLVCEFCNLKCTFQYANPDRKPRFCVNCGQEAKAEE